MMNGERDWQAENDADTLMQHAQVVGDSDRLQKAQSVLEERASNFAAALGEKPIVPQPGRHNNAATKGALKDFTNI